VPDVYVSCERRVGKCKEFSRENPGLQPLKGERRVIMSDYIERAQEILDADGKGVRYKTLTLQQIRKWSAWREPVASDLKAWSKGERMFAFEDGSVHFMDSGSTLHPGYTNAAEISEWISFLDGLEECWH
jgi:hypothetical protein